MDHIVYCDGRVVIDDTVYLLENDGSGTIRAKA